MEKTVEAGEKSDNTLLMPVFSRRRTNMNKIGRNLLEEIIFKVLAKE